MRRLLAAIIIIAWGTISWVLTTFYGIDKFALIVFGFLAAATAAIIAIPGSNLPPEASAPDLPPDVNDAVDTINTFPSANAPPSRRDKDASPH
jgi:hypothetical protein